MWASRCGPETGRTESLGGQSEALLWGADWLSYREKMRQGRTTWSPALPLTLPSPPVPASLTDAISNPLPYNLGWLPSAARTGLAAWSAGSWGLADKGNEGSVWMSNLL